MNRVLSSSIKAPIDLPPYRQSSMDGYALNISDDLSYEVLGEIKAGDNKNYNLLPGTSVRILQGQLSLIQRINSDSRKSKTKQKFHHT